jgi:hypothetical protein
MDDAQNIRPIRKQISRLIRGGKLFYLIVAFHIYGVTPLQLSKPEHNTTTIMDPIQLVLDVLQVQFVTAYMNYNLLYLSSQAGVSYE